MTLPLPMTHRTPEAGRGDDDGECEGQNQR